MRLISIVSGLLLLTIPFCGGAGQVLQAYPVILGNFFVSHFHKQNA